jgi:hypothetical protein
MHVVGVVEMLAGVLVLTRATRYAAYVVMFWLIGISRNLVSQGQFFDVAVRDVEIALGAFALARLSEVRAAELAYGAATSKQTYTRLVLGCSSLVRCSGQDPTARRRRRSANNRGAHLFFTTNQERRKTKEELPS